ncbi:MAG: hypothetical protein OXF02_00365 [Simkaniaceae bacterium]|nr:hypothetical protein [Simkaniaceae bacterium]
MLAFFREYQRYLFIVTAVIIIVSFSLFDVYEPAPRDTPSPDERVGESPVIGTTPYGSPITHRDVDDIGRFLTSERFDDGHFLHDFFASGLASLLAEAYFDEIKEEFGKRVASHRRSVFYRHPDAPFISAEGVWSRFLPEEKGRIDRFLRDEGNHDIECFTLLTKLYLAGRSLPPRLMREYLLTQERRYPELRPDPALVHADLRLFGCSSVEEWFGASFLRLLGRCIHNTALFAEKKGYRVSSHEALRDILQAEKNITGQNRNVLPDELRHLFANRLGMDKERVLAVKKKLLLARRLFDDYENAFFADTHALRLFRRYADSEVTVDLYEMPRSMHVANFEKTMKLSRYFTLLSPNGRNGKGMVPEGPFSPEEVGKVCPQLVRKRFAVELSEVKTESLVQEVSLKAVWDMQRDPEHLSAVRRHFPNLAIGERGEGIDTLAADSRREVDRFSALSILAGEPERIEVALDRARSARKEISIDGDGILYGLEGVRVDRELVSLLESEQNGEAVAALRRIRGGENAYYRIRVLDRDRAFHILTFEEAERFGIIGEMVERALRREHRALLEAGAHPSLLKTDTGEDKPFSEVRGEVARIVHAPLSDKSETFSLPPYFAQYMGKALRDIRERGGASSYVISKKENEGSDKYPPDLLSEPPPVDEQWKLRLSSVTIRRHQDLLPDRSTLFAMKEGTWSPPLYDSRMGRPYFFLVKTRRSGEADNEKEIASDTLARGRKGGNTAKQYFMRRLIAEWKGETGAS